eukprot:Platyproteum_vivax@DN441_c0_g1_i2.p1
MSSVPLRDIESQRPPPVVPEMQPLVIQIDFIEAEDSVCGECTNTVLNIVWLLAGGLTATVFWLVLGCLMCVSIILIPWGLQSFKLMQLSLLPFGRRLVRREPCCSCPSLFFNIPWALFGLVGATIHFLQVPL